MDNPDSVLTFSEILVQNPAPTLVEGPVEVQAAAPLSHPVTNPVEALV